MVKARLVLAAILVATVALLSIALTGVARPARTVGSNSVAGVNFACIAIANIGLCVGPPTTD